MVCKYRSDVWWQFFSRALAELRSFLFFSFLQKVRVMSQYASQCSSILLFRILFFFLQALCVLACMTSSIRKSREEIHPTNFKLKNSGGLNFVSSVRPCIMLSYLYVCAREHASEPFF